MYLDKDNILLHLYNFISIHNNHESHPQNISFPLYCKTYLINISPTGIVTLVRGTQKVNPMTLSDSKLVIKQSPPWVLRGFPATCRPKHESQSLKLMIFYMTIHDVTWSKPSVSSSVLSAASINLRSNLGLWKGHVAPINWPMCVTQSDWEHSCLLFFRKLAILSIYLSVERTTIIWDLQRSRNDK